MGFHLLCMSDIAGTLTFHLIYRVTQGVTVLGVAIFKYSDLGNSEVLVDVFKVGRYHFLVLARLVDPGV